MKTIAQQLKIKDFPFVIKDKNGKEIYYENSNGDWSKNEYDSNGNEIYWEYSNDFWCKREFDSNGYIIRYENSDGYWVKCERDSHGKEIYYENSLGDMKDNRPKQVELTLQQIADKLGVNVKDLKIKK